MVEITIEADKVIFEVQGWDKLWSLRSQLTIPLSHIKDVYADPEPAMGWFQGLKISGTSLPYIFRAGTFYQDGGFIFWDVSEPANTIVIGLDHERYKKLIVEVADPQREVATLRRALAANA